MSFLKRLATLFAFVCISFNSQAVPLIPSAPNLDAKSYILIDFDTGAILAEKASAEQVEPASITKLMTVYVAFQELKNGTLSLDDLVTVSKKARYAEGSRMFLEIGDQVKVKDIFTGIIVQSGNDASIALAEHIAGSEETFAQLMNQHAQALGMTQSNFHNATGLPSEGHLTTARDIATLASAIIREFPQYYSWYSQKEYTYNNIKQHNRNKLLYRDKSVDGLKTGHTESAGYCLVASAKRDDMRLISVVLGTDSDNARTSSTQALLNYGFRFFETEQLYAPGQTIELARAWGGASQTVAVGSASGLPVTIPRGQSKALQTKLAYHRLIEAPVKAGEVVGSIEVSLQGNLIASQPLVALKDVPKGGLFQQLKDKVLMLFEEQPHAEQAQTTSSAAE